MKGGVQLIYENYVRFRDMKGMSDADVARESGIAATTLSAWKRGEYTPKLQKLQAIANCLDISLNTLINDPDGN